MIELKDVTKTYKSKKGVAVKALDGLSLKLPSTGITFITGKSGCGKSTLLNVVGGLDAADDGSVSFNGTRFDDFSATDFDAYRNRHVGFVFQEYNLIDEYTVGENISLALELQGEPASREKVEAVLREVELTDEKSGETLFDRHINELSGGQKQRVAIARAIVKEPSIVLADEPTGALDSATSEQIYELLKRLGKDRLVIVVSHDRVGAEKYADRIIELKDGKVMGDTAESVADPNDEKADCSLKRGSLPFRRVLKMGVSGLKLKKFRLAMSIILSVFTLTILGFSFAATFADPLKTQLDATFASGYSQVILENVYAENKSNEKKFSQTQKEKIKEYNGGVMPPLVNSNAGLSVDLGCTFGYNLGVDYWRTVDYGIYTENASQAKGIIELDPDTGERTANIRPDERFKDKSLCRLPQNYNEIAITDMHADMFLEYGYLEKRDQKHRFKEEDLVKISSPDDLIGKTIGKRWDYENDEWTGKEWTIVGVYSTEIDRALIREKLENYHPQGGFVLNEYDSIYEFISRSMTISYTFAKEGYAEHCYNETLKKDPKEAEQFKYFKDGYLLTLGRNTDRDAAFIRSLSEGSGEEATVMYVWSPFSSLSGTYEIYTFWIVRVGLVAAGIFFVFSLLLTMSFLNVSIEFKKKTIGILRAMGASKGDITKICFAENMTIALIEYILSVITTAVVCAVLNGVVFYMPVLRVSIAVAALLLATCLATNLVCTLFNVVKTLKKKPVDIINNK